MGEQRKKVRSFAKRLSWRIAITQLIVMACAAFFIYRVTKEIVQDEEISLYKSYLKVDKQDIRRILSDVVSGTTNSVQEIEEHLDQPDKMYSIMKRMVEQNPHIRGCGISFTANYYPRKGRWFCPYAVRGDSTDVQKRFVGNADNDYLKASWFTEAVEADSSYWSKPFFDPTDSVPLVARLVPIHDKQGRTVAILGADLMLNWFNGLSYVSDDVKLYVSTKNYNEGSDGEGDDDYWDYRMWRGLTFKFIIDKDGTFIAHPDTNRVVHDNYFECAKKTADTTDDNVGREMVAGMCGTVKDKNGNATSFEFFDGGRFDPYIFYEPIKGTDWSMALVVPRYLIEATGIGMGIVMLILIAIALLVTRIVGRIIIKRTIKPLSKLADSAKEVAKGNFMAPLPDIKHNDEIRLLRDSFEGMQHSLSEYVDELKKTTASKAAIENELRVAHDIQMSMLPKTFPPYPERKDIDIYGTLTPAKDVGGDLFDFYIRDEKLFFCIGDVSGKGVPASLVMAVTRTLFRNVSAHVSKPDMIASAINNALAEGNATSMFVTLFIGILDLQTGGLNYCNAGHNSPLIIGRNVSLLPCDPNLPIGIESVWQFSCQNTILEPQSSIFLYTDGLNEAENINHAQFGDQRIMDVAESLAATETAAPTTIVNMMGKAVHSFVGDAEQSDDLTMLSIKYQNQTVVE